MNDLVHRLVAALEAADAVACAALLTDDAHLRLWRWDGSEAVATKASVVSRLVADLPASARPAWEVLGVVAGGERLAAELRIRTIEDGVHLEHNRSAFLGVRDGRIATLDLYCAEPIPTARGRGFALPAHPSEAELLGLAGSLAHGTDLRRSSGRRVSRRLSVQGTPAASPRSVRIWGAYLQASEAERRIAELVEEHRRHGAGFHWQVGPADRPADLAERLLAHGFVLAGEEALMVRSGLADLDIPVDAGVTIERLDGTSAESLEDILRVLRRCIPIPDETAAVMRTNRWRDLKDAELREEILDYIARVDGQAVGYARLILRAGVAGLFGAATVPEHRRRGVYSTLLRRRLEDARARGLEVATIVAGPMSRRVVEKHGFEERARFRVYAWMPVIDMAAIRTVVPSE